MLIAIYVVQNCSPLGQHKQKAYIMLFILNDNFVCLSCRSATFALQQGGLYYLKGYLQEHIYNCKLILKCKNGNPIIKAVLLSKLSFEKSIELHELAGFPVESVS